MRAIRRLWPFRHLGLKLLSLGLAVLLWIVVSGEETVERGLRVPLELQQFPSGLELQGEPPSNVDVRVRGASGTLGRLSPGDVVAVLDLRGARLGRRLFHLTSDQVRVPSGVDVVQVSPATVALVFENSATREVPVAPAIDGKPAPGYVVGRIAAEPKTVEIVGPESSVNRATEVLTEPVSVAGAQAPVVETVSIGLVDPALRLKTTRAATVTVQIVPAPLERTIHNVPVHLRNLPPRLSAQSVPSAVTVELRGGRSALGQVTVDDVTSFVDLAGLGSGEYMLTVRVDAPPDVGVVRVEPPTVQVRIVAGKD